MTKKNNPSERELLEAEGIDFMQLKDAPVGVRQTVVFTHEAPGAIPNGSRVRKINSRPPDYNQDGALATVEGSIGPVDEGPFAGTYGYFVRWDSRKDLQVFVHGSRVEVVTQ